MSDSTADRDPIEMLADSFLARFRRGERPSVEEYAAKHPELADEIRELLPALVMLEQGKSAVRSATGTNGGPDVTASGPAPRQLGDYLILREIGRGGMGVVFESVQQSLGRHVALKVLAHQALVGSTQVERFRLEARAAARLHHTNIVPVFGVGECEGVHYYAMQFIQGQSLDVVIDALQRLRKGSGSVVEAGCETPGTAGGDDQPLTAVLTQALLTGRFVAPQQEPEPRPEPTAATTEALSSPPSQGPAGPASSDRASGLPTTDAGGSSELSSGQAGTPYYRSVARVGVQVAEALAHAHGQGILHRDIKPSNLLLEAKGTVWVTDFGLAKAQDSDELTRTGDIVGTLRYMAPERFDGWSDPRSDVYALGATLYELMTLRPPFRESDRVKLIEQVIHEEPAPPHKLDRRIPRDLETIVLKALAKEPGQRYTTAEQMAEDLRRFAADRPILARRISPAERTWRWCKRNPRLAGAAGAVAAALVAVAVISVIYATEKARATDKISGLAADLVKERESLKESLSQSNRVLAIRNFERGQAAFEKAQIGPGLLWMIESWRSAVAGGDPVWRHAAQANLAAWRPYYPRLKAVLSHTMPVVAAAFSPDGRIVISGSEDGTAQLWDATTGLSLGSPLHQGGQWLKVAFSADGKTVLTYSQENTVRIWNVATGEPLGPALCLQPQVHILTVAILPDGKMLLAGTEASADNIARLWDAATGKLIGLPLTHQGHIYPPVFSPDGRIVLTLSDDGTARLWDPSGGRPVCPPLKHQGPVPGGAFSPDGKTILTGSRDGTARLWDAASGQPIGTPMRHESQVKAVAFSPDGKTIITGCEGKEARRWDAVTCKPIGLPMVHQGPVHVVAYSFDGRTMLTGSLDGTVRLWDAEIDQPVRRVIEQHVGLGGVMFSPDGTTILTDRHDGTARLWDAATGQPIGTPFEQQSGPGAVAFSPDGKTLYSATKSKTARLRDASTALPIGPIFPLQDKVNAAAFSPDGKTLVTGTNDGTIRLFDVSTGTPLGGPLTQPGTIIAVTFSPDGKTIVTGGEERALLLWDVATRRPLGGHLPHPGALMDMAFSPDGKTILTGGEDNVARLWDIATRTLLVPPLQHQGWVLSVAFSPDRKTVLTCGSDRTARLWDAATGMPIGPPLSHPNSVGGVAFSPDGKIILTGCADGLTRFFSMPELPEDLERATAWVEVLTGLTLDARRGSIHILDNAAWRASRARLEQLGGPPETVPPRQLDPVAYGPDPTARARTWIERKSWAEVEAAFDEVIRARPLGISLWTERGRYYLMRSQFGKAAEDFARAEELDPDDPELRYERAVSLLLAGDLAGYRAACAAMLSRFKDDENPNAANRVAYACIYGPDPVVDVPGLIRVAERSAPRIAGGIRIVGAALYRASRFTEALSRFEESHRVFQPRAWDWLFLAMIHGRLGHAEEARRMLEKADRWIAEVDRATQDSGGTRPRWSNEFEGPTILLLRREAGAVVRSGPVFPADPFAR